MSALFFSAALMVPKHQDTENHTTSTQGCSREAGEVDDVLGLYPVQDTEELRDMLAALRLPEIVHSWCKTME